MSNPCTHCHKPQTDAASLCHVCTADLSRLLTGARALAGELAVNVAKLDRTGIRTSARQSFARPLPISLPAAEVLWRLASTLATWELAIRKLPDLPEAMPAWRSADQNTSAAWLVAALPTFRMHDFAAQVLVDMRKITADALKVIDLPETFVFLGPCETPDPIVPDRVCHSAVYAKVGASKAPCFACRSEHDVAERRDWLLSSMEELTVTASTARKLALYLGVTMPAATISDWRRKGWVESVAYDHAGERELFRFGDLLALRRRVPTARQTADEQLEATA